MKICPECSFENPDTESVCQKCYASLSDIYSSDSSEKTEEFFAKIERKEKILKFIHIALIPLYYAICLPLSVMCYLKIKTAGVLFLIFLFLPLLYYFSIFKPEAIFYLQHMFEIDNIDEVEISDWYYISSRFGGYLILAFGIFAIIRISVSVLI